MKILVIEDDPTDLKLFLDILAATGQEVLYAESAEDALLLLQTTRVDLILVDILLPGMDGLALARTLKATQSFRHTPVMAITSSSEWPFDRLSRMAGCEGFTQKPIDTRVFPGRLIDLARAGAKAEPQRTPRDESTPESSFPGSSITN